MGLKSTKSPQGSVPVTSLPHIGPTSYHLSAGLKAKTKPLREGTLETLQIQTVALAVQEAWPAAVLAAIDYLGYKVQ